MFTDRNSRRQPKLPRAVLVLAAFLLAGLASSQGDLYGEAAPPDAAWIRIINLATSEPLTVSLDGTELTAEHASASGYQAVEAGAHALADGDVTIELSAEPGTFVTVAFMPDGPVVIEDPALRDISRGLLGLMNLTSRASLSLVTPGGETVVEGVGPGEAQAIQVSAATTALQVLGEGATVAELDEHAYERGEAYTVIVHEGEDGVVAFLVTAAGLN